MPAIATCYRLSRPCTIDHPLCAGPPAEVSAPTPTCAFARRLPAAQDAAIEQCIREYEGIAVWTVTRDATTGAITSVRFPEEDIALAL